jgi:hypothetical protein
MNKPLKLVREFHEAFSFPQAEGNTYAFIRYGYNHASGIAHGSG